MVIFFNIGVVMGIILYIGVVMGIILYIGVVMGIILKLYCHGDNFEIILSWG
jgi:hypothetical protein